MNGKRSGMGGLTLIELMAALLIFSFAAAGTMKFLVLQLGWVSRARDAAEAQQESRIAMDLVVRELGLLGFGVPSNESRLLKAGPEEVEFLANLDHEFTRLAGGEGPGATVLAVDGTDIRPGHDFEGGRTVSICGGGRCEWNTLAGDAADGTLRLAQPLGGFFPAGSTVQVINRVRYAVRPAGAGRLRLVRTEDGGANPVAESLEYFALSYFDREGRESTDLSAIRRVQIRMGASAATPGGPVRRLEGGAWLRNQKEAG